MISPCHICWTSLTLHESAKSVQKMCAVSLDLPFLAMSCMRLFFKLWHQPSQSHHVFLVWKKNTPPKSWVFLVFLPGPKNPGSAKLRMVMWKPNTMRLMLVIEHPNQDLKIAYTCIYYIYIHLFNYMYRHMYLPDIIHFRFTYFTFIDQLGIYIQWVQDKKTLDSWQMLLRLWTFQQTPV